MNKQAINKCQRNLADECGSPSHENTRPIESGLMAIGRSKEQVAFGRGRGGSIDVRRRASERVIFHWQRRLFAIGTRYRSARVERHEQDDRGLDARAPQLSHSDRSTQTHTNTLTHRHTRTLAHSHTEPTSRKQATADRSDMDKSALVTAN